MLKTIQNRWQIIRQTDQPRWRRTSTPRTSFCLRNWNWWSKSLSFSTTVWYPAMSFSPHRRTSQPTIRPAHPPIWTAIPVRRVHRHDINQCYSLIISKIEAAKKEPVSGFEPETSCLLGKCSTTKLYRLHWPPSPLGADVPNSTPLGPFRPVGIFVYK